MSRIAKLSKKFFKKIGLVFCQSSLDFFQMKTKIFSFSNYEIRIMLTKKWNAKKWKTFMMFCKFQTFRFPSDACFCLH